MRKNEEKKTKIGYGSHLFFWNKPKNGKCNPIQDILRLRGVTVKTTYRGGGVLRSKPLAFVQQESTGIYMFKKSLGRNTLRMESIFHLLNV